MTTKDFALWLYRNQRYRARVLPAIWCVILFWTVAYLLALPLLVDTAAKEALIEIIYPFLPFPLLQQYWATQFRYPLGTFALIVDFALIPLTVLFLLNAAVPAFRKILHDQQGKMPGADEFQSAVLAFLLIAAVLGLILLYGHTVLRRSSWLLLWPTRGVLAVLFAVSVSLGLAGLVALVTRPRPSRKPVLVEPMKWKFLHRGEGGKTVTGLVRLVQVGPKDIRFQLSRFDARNASDLQLWLAHDLQTSDGPVPDQFLGFIEKDQSQQDIPVNAAINLAAYRYVTIRQDGLTQPLAYALL